MRATRKGDWGVAMNCYRMTHEQRVSAGKRGAANRKRTTRAQSGLVPGAKLIGRFTGHEKEIVEVAKEGDERTYKLDDSSLWTSQDLAIAFRW